jgi:hypothetical protein
MFLLAVYGRRKSPSSPAVNEQNRGKEQHRPESKNGKMLPIE